MSKFHKFATKAKIIHFLYDYQTKNITFNIQMICFYTKFFRPHLKRKKLQKFLKMPKSSFQEILFCFLYKFHTNCYIFYILYLHKIFFTKCKILPFVAFREQMTAIISRWKPGVMDTTKMLSQYLSYSFLYFDKNNFDINRLYSKRNIL